MSSYHFMPGCLGFLGSPMLLLEDPETLFLLFRMEFLLLCHGLLSLLKITDSFSFDIFSCLVLLLALKQLNFAMMQVYLLMISYMVITNL